MHISITVGHDKSSVFSHIKHSFSTWYFAVAPGKRMSSLWTPKHPWGSWVSQLSVDSHQKGTTTAGEPEAREGREAREATAAVARRWNRDEFYGGQRVQDQLNQPTSWEHLKRESAVSIDDVCSVQVLRSTIWKLLFRQFGVLLSDCSSIHHLQRCWADTGRIGRSPLWKKKNPLTLTFNKLFHIKAIKISRLKETLFFNTSEQFRYINGRNKLFLSFQIAIMIVWLKKKYKNDWCFKKSLTLKKLFFLEKMLVLCKFNAAYITRIVSNSQYLHNQTVQPYKLIWGM